MTIDTRHESVAQWIHVSDAVNAAGEKMAKLAAANVPRQELWTAVLEHEVLKREMRKAENVARKAFGLPAKADYPND